MDDDRREELTLLERLVVATEKGAEAQAKLIELANEERAIDNELIPPFCPHCKAVNPQVRSEYGEGAGSIAEFVLIAQCMNCNRRIFGVPSEWVVVTTAEEANQVRSMRGGR